MDTSLIRLSQGCLQIVERFHYTCTSLVPSPSYVFQHGKGWVWGYIHAPQWQDAVHSLHSQMLATVDHMINTCSSVMCLISQAENFSCPWQIWGIRHFMFKHWSLSIAIIEIIMWVANYSSDQYMHCVSAHLHLCQPSEEGVCGSDHSPHSHHHLIHNLQQHHTETGELFELVILYMRSMYNLDYYITCSTRSDGALSCNTCLLLKWCP